MYYIPGALSDVNSMIDFNDNNRYGSRRQSSLSGSSICPYASDSFCDDDDDDDYNDEDELIFQNYCGYDVDNEKHDFGEDDNDNGRVRDFQHVLQQKHLLLQPDSQPSTLDGAHTDNNYKRYVYVQSLFCV